MRRDAIAMSMAPYAVERFSEMKLAAYNLQTLDETGDEIGPDMLTSVSCVEETDGQAKSQLTASWKYDNLPGISSRNGVILYARSNEAGSAASDWLMIDRFDDVDMVVDEFSRTVSLTAQKTGTSLGSFGRTKGDRTAFFNALTVAATIDNVRYVTLEDMMTQAFDVNTAKTHYTLNLIYQDGVDGLPAATNELYKTAGDRLVRYNYAGTRFDGGDFVNGAIDAVNAMLREGLTYEAQAIPDPDARPNFSYFDEDLGQTVDAVYQLRAFMDAYGGLYVGWFGIHEWYFSGSIQMERDVDRYDFIWEYPGVHGEITNVVLDGSRYKQIRRVKDTVYAETYELPYRGDIRLMAEDVVTITSKAWDVDPITREGVYDGAAQLMEAEILRHNLDYSDGVLTGKILCARAAIEEEETA